MKLLTRVPKATLTLALALGLLASSACKDRQGNPVSRETVLQAVHSQFDMKLLPEVTPHERKMLVDTVTQMLRTDLGETNLVQFSQVFGGPGMANVVNYLNERIHYVVPFVVVKELMGFGQDPARAREEAALGAANISAMIYFMAVMKRAAGESAEFPLGDKLVPVNSTRIGLITLGPRFLDVNASTEVAEGVRIPETWVNRSSYLVHEARHSDCKSAPSVESIRHAESSGDYSGVRECGYHHLDCPAKLPGFLGEEASAMDHPYVGMPACDGTAWGSYAIQGLYLRRLSECKSCTEAERQEAMIALLDVVLRFGSLDQTKGTPDMSSI